MRTFRIVRDKVHIEYLWNNSDRFNPGLLLERYAAAQQPGYTDRSKRNRFFTKPLSKYKVNGVGFSSLPRGHGYMDGILKKIFEQWRGGTRSFC